MKRFLSSISTLFLALGLISSCATNKPQVSDSNGNHEITIVYTNDIHSYIANKAPALRISKISQMAQDFKSQGKNVLLVDAGDAIQGSTYGSIDNGYSVIELMNKSGYNLATPGNHEFDYGVDNFYKIASKAKFPYISCNFHPISEENKSRILPATKIFDIGGKKIAFVGISTPETITSSTPTKFQDGKGNFIYSIDGTENYEDFYRSVQKAIDSVRKNADYVVALAHVGVGIDEKIKKISSFDVIQNTTGIDAYIDGHSHTEMEENLVKDKSGKNVLLTQTGSYLNAVGIMTIDEKGNFSSKLVNDYSGSDKKIEVLENNLIKRINDILGQKIADLETELYINDPKDEKVRLIRAKELNIGDFVSDSIYWFFNEKSKIDCDIVIYNAGGIRASIKAGEVTENDIKNVSPFGNQICMIQATGQQIKDALEMGAVVAGIWDKQWNTPAENGGFLQVAGMKYTIDPNIKSNVIIDENKMFKSVNGAYKVKDIQVYNKKTASYEDLNLSKTYTIGGINYILRDSGNGLSMFKDCNGVVDFVGQDSEILSSYMKSFSKKGNYPNVKSENSSLSKYKGYLINYENPFGAGRIKIEELKK